MIKTLLTVIFFGITFSGNQAHAMLPALAKTGRLALKPCIAKSLSVVAASYASPVRHFALSRPQIEQVSHRSIITLDREDLKPIAAFYRNNIMDLHAEIIVLAQLAAQYKNDIANLQATITDLARLVARADTAHSIAQKHSESSPHIGTKR